VGSIVYWTAGSRSTADCRWHRPFLAGMGRASPAVPRRAGAVFSWSFSGVRERAPTISRGGARDPGPAVATARCPSLQRAEPIGGQSEPIHLVQLTVEAVQWSMWRTC